MIVEPLDPRTAAEIVVREHYLHRRPPISFAYALVDERGVVGCCIFGVPASRHLQKSACPTEPDNVIELNRLWVDDRMPRNTETWFVARVLALLPPRIVVSYADTAEGHAGYVYRAANFNYAGWTDMERKTPRFDYVVPQGHSRDAFRSGKMRADVIRVRRKPKVKYWTVTGDRRERRTLIRLCGWPRLSWKETPPPVGFP